ncbi:hypothetical protein SELMODRAFT_123584 [Selaginella moellendorffii]|uniref:DYW domain-containing protein n=1 Tax=Selaginella moellendorffii TaxID=88036 RepID=D8SS79_SELML|nr:hypothetical protein SELMODRAFT_123584 [Selaginella moellendorffii]
MILGKCPDAIVDLVRACARSRHLGEARRLHAQILDSPNRGNKLVLDQLVIMYGKCGSVEDAREMFDSMAERNEVSWNALLAAYAQRGDVEEVVEVFWRMIVEGVSPDEVAFVTVLTACSHAGLLETSWELFVSMREDHGLRPLSQHYLCMIDVLGRSGLLSSAEELIATMPFVPDEVAWGMLLAACKVHKDVSRAARIARDAVAADPEDCSSYVSLGNTLGVTVEEKDGDLRRLGFMTGLSKQPGISLIIVNSEMHSFTSGDESHPRIHEIRAELQRLTSQMRESGYVPDTHDVFHAVSEAGKSELVWHHSEKLAIAFGLISTSPGVPLWIRKNLRVCLDCHSATKFISKVTGRSIVVRDSYRFHKFENGSCSCGDFW